MCGIRGLDASLNTETMMELEQNAKRAIPKHKFWEVCFGGAAEKIPPFFSFFFVSGDK